ncbi:Oxygen regulatory protein NreC [subsurface metagenome]
MAKMSQRNMISSIRSIIIVEDHPVLREGLKKIINHEEDLSIIGEAWDVRSAWAAIKAKKPDLVIIDISLGESNGLELIKELKVHYEELPILVLSMHDEILFAERAIQAGAKGYITKSEQSDVLLAAIRKVLSGKYYVGESIVSRIFNRFFDCPKNLKKSPIERLSNREMEVLQLMGMAKGSRQIAEALYLSIKTVQTYQQRIKDKLGLNNATELIQYASQWVNTEA